MDNRPPLGRADLHIHPSGNWADAETTTAIYEALRTSGLQVAVLSEHDRIDVAKALVQRSNDEGISIELVVGEEVTTSQGHLLGIGLSERVPAGRPLGVTIALVHEQGAIVVVAHPLLPAYLAAPGRLLIELAEGDPDRRPDALEGMHPTAAWFPGWRRRVERLAGRCGYAVVGGSDAHTARSVGRVWTSFPGTNATDLYAAIQSRQTSTEGRRHALRDIFRGHGRRSNEDSDPPG
ncbi:MAG: PHP domain-containing protein [Candidatus Limnocylindrales bacterium]